AKQNGINYTTLIGNKDMTDLYGGIMSIPATFVIDRNGGIRERYIGYQGKEVFERDIKELL
ncbi:MAG: TlpA family protein disulfide reductase, partial [Candidatus Altiarchaeota archaeon]|nr:TlpA family protein disulfide reductase [Candidatus Altiarchaeota archaeon]